MEEERQKMREGRWKRKTMKIELLQVGRGPRVGRSQEGERVVMQMNQLSGLNVIIMYGAHVQINK